MTTATPTAPGPRTWSGPLCGLRVVVLGGIGPVPFAGMVLADLGADVVRLDRPETVRDPLAAQRRRGDLMQRGSRSIGVDLGAEGASDLVRWLAERADVILEGFRPGVIERLGIGPEALLETNPRLVVGRQTGWGQDGPLAPRAGHDITYAARSGALHAIGPADGDPVVPLNLVADFGGGGLMLVIGVLAALHEVERSGAGQVVDSAMVDGASALTTMFHGMLASGTWIDRRGANLIDGAMPYYRTYRTKDDRHVAVGALEDKFFAELCGQLGIAPVPDRSDPLVVEHLHEVLAARFRERTQAEWDELFAGTDACVAPVRSLREAPLDPHLSARGTFVEVEGVVQPGVPLRFSRTPAHVDAPPPVPGAHATEVIADWGGAHERRHVWSEALVVAPSRREEAAS